jgi:hypothetical protein
MLRRAVKDNSVHDLYLYAVIRLNWRPGRAAILAIAVAAIACGNAKIDRPAPPLARTGPEMARTTSENRDTLFARALRTVRERGYTEVSPDPLHWEVRAKSPTRLSVVVSFVPVGDSTKVTVQASGDRRSAGIDNDAMSTVLTLMSDIAPPPSARVAPAKTPER